MICMNYGIFRKIGHYSQFLCKSIRKFDLEFYKKLSNVPYVFPISVGETEGDPRVRRLYAGLLNRDRVSLAESITLVESHHPKKKAQANELLSLILKNAENKYQKLGQKSLSFRIGLTGPPGSGKSTFIEAFGKMLTSAGHRVAVLAVDPSSSTTGGSLLGDRTRMLELSRDPNAYIRPSPAGTYAGGVARSTNDSVLLCESAGYDVIIVETVGVGQSEYAAADMVDLFALLLPPVAGDELQGIKRGVVELADLIIVNKADGNLVKDARLSQTEYTSALKYVRSRSKVWRPKVMRVSSIKKEGLDKVWNEMQDFWDETLEAGELEAKRRRQYRVWMWNHIEHHLKLYFRRHPRVSPYIDETEKKVTDGILTPGTGADILLHKLFAEK
ncbi:methylmalonic aciduria type A protein, mitochondrial-like [Centruroides vittatus]|uniref:methylmalonic aciduria type A protein, mitochondrial-like n=1 Tax=Centruroides vittatus TaxID=120091 RepID=UPI00350F6C7B